MQWGGGNSAAAAVGSPFGISEERMAEIDKWAKGFIYREKDRINLPETISGILSNDDLNGNEKCYVHMMFGGILGSEMAHERRVKSAMTIIAKITRNPNMEEATKAANNMMRGEA